MTTELKNYKPFYSVQIIAGIMLLMILMLTLEKECAINWFNIFSVFFCFIVFIIFSSVNGYIELKK
jgi:hypothetical protein